MKDGWTRLVPLTGVVVVVLGAGLIALPASPSASASAAKAVSFFSEHRRSQEASAFVVWYAMLFTVVFAASVRKHLRDSGASDSLVALGFLGSGFFALAFSVAAGMLYAAADVPTKISPSAEQALNVVQDNVFPAVFVGLALAMLGYGLAIVRAQVKMLPAWLGWLALLVALAAVIPPASPVSLLGFLLWTLLTSVILFLRQGRAASAVTAPASPESGPLAAQM
jgi:hypothetical protein